MLPSTIGGDVVRVARASNTVGSSEVSFGSVVLERLTGFVALPLLVFAGFAIRPSLIDRTHAWIALLVAVRHARRCSALILFVAGHPAPRGPLRGARELGRGSSARCTSASNACAASRARSSRSSAPRSLFQTSQVVMFGLIFRALDLPVPIAAVIAFAPAVLMLQVLPISFSGLGVREGALVLFLRSFDVSNAQAFAAGLLWWGCMIA